MAKPPPTNEEIAARKVEPDPIAAIGDAAAAGNVATSSTTGDAGSELSNDRFEVPPSPLARADKVLASAQARVHPPIGGAAPARPSALADVTAASRKYAQEQYASDMIDEDEQYLDLMVSNVVRFQVTEPAEPGWWREFLSGELIVVGQNADGDEIKKSEGMLAYEAFMNDPVGIRVHSTKDKNEAPIVFVGVNGDCRWLPRDRPVRVQRRFVERLAQAQEMAFRTEPDPDPRVDQAMRVVRTTAASYEFSVLHDPAGPLGRRWLKRVTREGT